MTDLLPTLANLLIIFGGASFILATAAPPADHTPYFFGVSKALRAVFPVHVTHEPDQFIQIISDLDEVER